MVIWSLIFLLIVAIAITIIVSYAFYVGKGEESIKFDDSGNLTTPGVITAANLSPNNKEEILALQHKTQFFEVNGDTTTVNGNLQVKGTTTTNESVVNVYDGYVQITQNPADGNTPSLSISQAGASSGPIMLVTDTDTNKIFEIGQNSEIYSSGGLTLEGDLIIGTGLRTATFGVNAATGNTTISGNLEVIGDISGNNFGGNYFTDIGGVTANSPTTTLNIVGGNGIVVTPDDTAKSITFSLDSAVTDQINTLSNDVGTLQTNVGTLQTNVGTLQTDVGTLQTDVGTLTTTTTDLQITTTTLSDKVIHITATPTSTEFSENITTGGNLLVTGDITSNANVNGSGANFTTLYSSESVYVGSNITATNFSTDINRTLTVGDLGLDVIVTEAPLPRTLPTFGGQLFSVSTLAGLQSAISSAVDGDTVSLTADITLSTTLAVNSGIRLTSDNGSRKITLNLLNATTIQWNAPSGLIQGITIESLGQGSNEVGLALTNVGGDIYIDGVYFNVDEFGVIVNSLQVQITGCTFNYARLPANESMRYIQLLRTGNYSQNIIDSNTFNGVTSSTSSIQCITTANAAAGSFPNSTFVVSNNNSNGNVQRLFMLDGTDMTGSQCQWFLKNNNLSCTSGFFIWYSASALQDQIAFYLDGNTEVLGGSATGSKGLIGFDNVTTIDSINFNCKIKSRNNTIPVLRSDYSNLSLPDIGVVAFATGKITPTQTFDSIYYDDVTVDGTLTVNGPATFNGTVETDGVTSNSITSNVITSNTLITSAIGIDSSPTAGSVIDAGDATSSIILPKGTTAQQPTPVDGMMRYNTETGGFEGVSNNSWAPLAAGGSGPVWTSETTNLGSPTNYLPVPAPYYTNISNATILYQDSEDDYVTFTDTNVNQRPIFYNAISGAITTLVTGSAFTGNMARIVTSGTMVMVLSSTTTTQFKLDEYSYNGTALTFVRNIVTISGTFRTYGLKMINTTGGQKILSFGSYNTSNNVGSVYLFNYDGTNWTQSLNSPLTVANTGYAANDTFIVWNTNLNVYQLALYDVKSTGSNLYFWNLTNTGGAVSIPSTSIAQTISYSSASYNNSQASYDDADVNRPYFHISLGAYNSGGFNNVGGFVSSYRWDGVQWSLATDWQVFNYTTPTNGNINTGYIVVVGTVESPRCDITPIKTYDNKLLISSKAGNFYQFTTTKTDTAPYFSVEYVNTLRSYGGSLITNLNITYGISPNGNYVFTKPDLISLPFINVYRLGDGTPITQDYYQTTDIVRSTKIVGVENGGYVELGVTVPSTVDTNTLKNGTLVFDGNELYIYANGWRRITLSQ